MANEHTILLAEINAQQQNLKRILAILKSQNIPAAYRNIIYAKFALAISPLDNDLKELITKVENGNLNQQGTVACWQEIAQIRDECNNIFAQLMDFLGGIAVRDMKLEEGMCRVAEHLVSETYRASGLIWSSVLIVGEERLFQEIAQTTQFIRLRFPEWDIWNLPFTAHEFGVLLASTDQVKGIQDLYKGESDRLKRLIEGKKLSKAELEGIAPFLLDLRGPHHNVESRSLALHHQRLHMKNLFADMFATYFLGPAYIYARLFLRLDPASFDRNKNYEPSFIRRFSFMLNTLEKMNDRYKSSTKKTGPYTDELDNLKEYWNQTIRSVLPLYDGSLAIHKPFDEWFGKMWKLFYDTYSLVGFSKEDWESASDLGEKLNNFAQEAETAELSESATLPVILNAAWYSRVRLPLERPAVIEKKVRSWCDQIIPTEEVVKPAAATGPSIAPPIPSETTPAPRN